MVAADVLRVAVIVCWWDGVADERFRSGKSLGVPGLSVRMGIVDDFYTDFLS